MVKDGVSNDLEHTGMWSRIKDEFSKDLEHRSMWLIELLYIKIYLGDILIDNMSIEIIKTFVEYSNQLMIY